MGQPSTIQGYEAEWALIANQLQRDGSMTLPVGSPKVAARLRFRYYGFRKALVKHDPTNPWVAVLMETQCTITPTGDLHFERSPYATLIRGMLEHSIVKETPKLPDPASVDAEQPLAGHDLTILQVLSGDKPRE